LSKQADGWWTSEFFEAFRPAFGLIDKKATNAQVKYLITKLKLKPGSSFLDCPCGIGRVSMPLARRGIRVTGVDITQSYLDELDNKAKRAKLNIKTIHGDMRRINFDSRFDAGGNLWTSFGFFNKESDNLLTLKKMYKALKPGGRFALHLINRDWVTINFQTRGWQDLGKTRILESRKFDYRTSTSQSKWSYIRDGKEQVFDVNMRMFSYHELVGLFESVGFIDIEGYGGVKDEPISRESRMMWIFGTKPRR
jgi:cyclopropane fatty-acyl-phospholipid synthase-like methyltransferase